MRRILLLAAAATLAACSSQPTTSPTAPAPVTAPTAPAVATPAAASSEATTAAPAAATSDTNADTGTAAEKLRKIPSGYRMEKRNGKELYCRNVTTLGSRFPQKTCFTREQLEEIQRRTESAMGDMEKGMKVCVGIEGCGLN